MNAIKFYDIRDMRLEEIPEPKPTDHEILLKVASVGICGSDVHYFEEGGTGSLQLDHPLILGHEFSAWMDTEEKGKQLVTVDPAIPCGKCEYCLEGNPNFCVNLQFAGSEDTNGAMQEVIAWPKENIYPLPDHISPQEAALFEPLGIAIHALRLGKVFPGMHVGVFGSGSVGLLTIQMAKAAGAARIFATDRLEHRLQAALECGATDVFMADGDESRQILKETNGRGCDVTFEAAGDDGTAVEAAIQASKRGGTTVLIGIPNKDTTSFTASTARRKGLTIKMSRRMKHTYPIAAQLVSQKMVNLQPLITHQFNFEEFNQAFQTAASREGIKVFLNFSLE